MPLNFTIPNKYTEGLKIRFKPQAYRAVIEYAQMNDMDSFNDALQVILMRISRIGVKRFYDMTTADKFVSFQNNVHGNDAKVININTNNGSVSDESPAQSP